MLELIEFVYFSAVATINRGNLPHKGIRGRRLGKLTWKRLRTKERNCQGKASKRIIAVDSSYSSRVLRKEYEPPQLGLFDSGYDKGGLQLKLDISSEV